MPYLGKQPASVPVTADDIPNDSITTAKIVDAAITIADIGPNAVGSSEMADDAVGLNELSATGTTNTSTFLRGDNSWAVPPDNNTVYTHPNHSGEVTSTADGAQVIADNVVDEANLKVSNSPTNGQFLSAQSGNTGGLTWATVDTSTLLPLAGGTMTGNIAHAGAFTIDTVGDISLDSEGAILIKNGGSAIGRISNSSSDMIIKSDTSDKDILFKGNDGGSTVTALKLDMSAAGAATFGSYVDLQTNNLYLSDNAVAKFGSSEDLQIYHDGTHSYIKDVGTGDLRIKGTDLSLRSDSADEPYINCTENGAVKLYYDNVSRLETMDGGVKVANNGTFQNYNVAEASTNIAAAAKTITISGLHTLNPGNHWDRMSIWMWLTGTGGGYTNVTSKHWRHEIQAINSWAIPTGTEVYGGTPPTVSTVTSNSNTNTLQFTLTQPAGNAALRIVAFGHSLGGNCKITFS